MSERREIQPELFQDFGQPVKLRKRFLRPDAAKKVHTIILSNEQLIFIFIGLVILLVICFSLGAERGKRIIPVEKKQVRQEVIVEKLLPKQEPAAESKISAPAPVIEKGSGLYFIQVASYIDGKQAEAEKEYLQKRGYKVGLVKSGKHTVINMIGFANRQEAEVAALKIKDRYEDYLIRKRK